jgi:hypothetical protein
MRPITMTRVPASQTVASWSRPSRMLLRLSVSRMMTFGVGAER